jgi:hypothetical protein
MFTFCLQKIGLKGAKRVCYFKKIMLKYKWGNSVLCDKEEKRKEDEYERAYTQGEKSLRIY